MNLSQNDIALFYKLWYELNWSINQKHGIVPEFDKPTYGQRVDQQIFITIRNERIATRYITKMDKKEAYRLVPSAFHRKKV